MKVDQGYAEDIDKRRNIIYDSAIHSFGVNFSINSKGYYPDLSRKSLYEEHAMYSKCVSKETFED